MPKSRKKALSRLSGKMGTGTRPYSCTANLAHVHKNWAKTRCAHVFLAKKRSAGQHRVKRTFGQNGHRYPTLLMYMKTGRKHGARMGFFQKNAARGNIV